MNVEKLHALAIDLLDDYDKTGMPASLISLVQTLKKRVSSPAEPTFQQSLSENLGKIREELPQAPSNDFPNEWKDMMEQLRIDGFFGEKMLETIDNIFYQNQITPSLAMEKLVALLISVQNTHTHMQRVVGAFQFFNIEKDDLEQGQCEICIAIPKNHKNTLGELGQEMRQLDIDFRPLATLLNQTSDEFKVRSLSSSDLTVFIETGAPLCFAILMIIHTATNIYTKLLKAKEIRSTIAKSDILDKTVEEAVAKSMENKFESLVKEHAKALTKEIRKELKLDSSATKGREPKELEGNIERSIKNTTNRLDKGIRFNIRGELHIIEPKDSDDDNARRIAKKKELDNNFIQKIINGRKLLLEFNPNIEELHDLLPDFSETESDTSQNQNDEDSK